MQNKIKILSAALIILSIPVFSQSSYALDKVPPDTTSYVEIFEVEEETTAYQPNFSIGFGFSNRIDNDHTIESDPSLNIRLMDYFMPTSAAKFGFSFSRQRFKQTYGSYRVAQINVLMVETGVQWMIPARLVRPFIGLTFEYNFYDVTNYDLTENRIGMNIVVGSEVSLTETLHINFEISQTLNDVSYGDIDYYLPSLGNDDEFIYGIYNGKLLDDIYNHAAVKVFLLYTL